MASSARSSSAWSSTPMVGSSRMGRLAGEQLPQPQYAVADAGFHGPEWRALARGDLAVGEPFEVRDLDGPPLLGGQRGEPGAYPCGALTAHDRLVRPLGRDLLARIGGSACFGSSRH